MKIYAPAPFLTENTGKTNEIKYLIRARDDLGIAPTYALFDKSRPERVFVI